jgi:hypothetical protein
MISLPRSKGWLIAWWLVWTSILAQQLLLHTWRHVSFEDNPSFSRTTYVVVLMPLMGSIVLRWLVWPRTKLVGSSFAVFLAGLVLAAMSGLSVTFLAVPYREITFLFCLAGVLEFVPITRTSRE